MANDKQLELFRTDIVQGNGHSLAKSTTWIIETDLDIEAGQSNNTEWDGRTDCTHR